MFDIALVVCVIAAAVAFVYGLVTRQSLSVIGFGVSSAVVVPATAIGFYSALAAILSGHEWVWILGFVCVFCLLLFALFSWNLWEFITGRRERWETKNLLKGVDPELRDLSRGDKNFDD